MRIAVIGSRTFTDYDLLKHTLDQIDDKDLIISGGARGADSLAREYALENNITYCEFQADWSDLSHPEARVKTNRYGQKYDANAGFRRNIFIVDQADLVVAFHNGSPGTAHSLRIAKQMGKNILEITFT